MCAPRVCCSSQFVGLRMFAMNVRLIELVAELAAISPVRFHAKRKTAAATAIARPARRGIRSSEGTSSAAVASAQTSSSAIFASVTFHANVRFAWPRIETPGVSDEKRTPNR